MNEYFFCSKSLSLSNKTKVLFKSSKDSNEASLSVQLEAMFLTYMQFSL